MAAVGSLFRQYRVLQDHEFSQLLWQVATDIVTSRILRQFQDTIIDSKINFTLVKSSDVVTIGSCYCFAIPHQCQNIG